MVWRRVGKLFLKKINMRGELLLDVYSIISEKLGQFR